MVSAPLILLLLLRGGIEPNPGPFQVCAILRIKRLLLLIICVSHSAGSSLALIAKAQLRR